MDQPKTELSTSLQPLPAKWIEKMFDKMLLDYGKKFTDQWSGADPDKLISHWSHELSGFIGAELKRGYDALSYRDWPPSLPEFKRMCRPRIDALVAYYEAIAGVQARQNGEMGAWSHPAIFWAAMPLAFDLNNQTFSQIKVRWEIAFAEQMDRGQWADIPAPLLALPEPENKLSREDAAAMLKKLGAADVLKKPSNDSYHKAWAHKIKAREKQGDRTLTAVIVRFANEALAA